MGVRWSPGTQMYLIEAPRLRGQECGGRYQPEDCRIPTKPAGGLLSDIGKVAPTLGWAGVPYQTALIWFYVPPWALFYTLLQAPTRATISTIQQEWNLLPEGARRVMETTYSE